MKREIESNPFILRNAVSGGGYEWAKEKGGKSYLVMLNAPGAALHIKELPPGLFREFAELKTSPEAIQGFAAEYGDLFNHWRHPLRGTSFTTWKEEIGEMRVLVGLWDRIKKRDISELKRIITLTKDGPWYSIVTPKHDVTGSCAYESTPPSRNEAIRFTPIEFGLNDVVLPAKCALQIEINKRLAEHSTIPLLTWTPDTKKTTGGYHQRLTFKPSNLLASMWIQFAMDVTEKLEIRQCHCGKYFQVGPGAKRADAMTCSDVCRANRPEGMGRKTRKSLR